MLNSNGVLVGSQLYGPYGNQRYNNGTLPTSIGFTGQRADSVTGLDYYVARYYDPAVGVFLSPDSVQGNAQGMDPYAYVDGNPESKVDPTGQRVACPSDDAQDCLPDGSPKPPSGGNGDDSGTGGNCGSGTSGNGNKCTTKPPEQITPKNLPKKKPWCAIVCGGVGDWWQLGKGFVGFLGNSAALAILIAAFTGAEATTDGVATFLANFVVSVGAGIIRNMIESLRGMADSFVEHNPVIDIVASILEIGLDLVSLLSMGKGFKAIQEIGAATSSLQVARLFNAVGQIFAGKKVDFIKYVGPAVSTILGVVNIAIGATTLIQDGLQLGDDISHFSAYAADHDPSSGWA